MSAVTDGLSKLFHAFGLVSADRLSGFAEAILGDCHCETCISMTCAKLAKTAPRMVVPAQFISAYRDLFDIEHYRHAGQSSRAAEAGIAEAFWRKDAPKVVAAAYGVKKPAAERIAAAMWASGTVVPDAGWVREECETTEVWKHYAPHVETDRTYAVARAVASKDPTEMTDSEWAGLNA